MKFNVSSKLLYSRVSAVSKVISSKNALAVLNNFLFEIVDNTLVVTASDLENTLVTTIEVMNAEGEGKFCIDARRMVDVLKELPDQGVEFVIDDSTYAVEVSYNSGNFSFVAIDGNEFPTGEDTAGEDAVYTFAYPAQAIIEGLDNTLFAVGTDDLRPQMMGVLWDIAPDHINFVATDTRKLVRFSSVGEPGFSGSFILPVKPATVLKNVFAKDSEVKVVVTTKSVTFDNGVYRFNCRFIKGSFPDYTRVIPSVNAYEVTVDRVSFLNAVRRVAVFVDPNHGLVKFKIAPDKIMLRAVDNNYCTSAYDEVACGFNGNEMLIGFSAPYLVEIASTITSEELIIKLSDPSRPGVFVPADGKDGQELLMLLMPMTVSEF